jgi:hypothetical protein
MLSLLATISQVGSWADDVIVFDRFGKNIPTFVSVLCFEYCRSARASRKSTVEI